MLGSFERGTDFGLQPITDQLLKNVTGAICSPFADSGKLEAGNASVAWVHAEASEQERGWFRLGGVGYHQVIVNRPGWFFDSEDVHSLHRLYWAVRYAQAAAYGAGNAESALVRDLEAWMGRDWAAERRVGYAYTTSERIASVVEVLHWIRCGRLRLAAAMAMRIKGLIVRDARHLENNVEEHLGPHNHVINNARALYQAGRAVPEAPDSRRWVELAFDLWQTYFEALVLDDGCFSEASSSYSIIACRTALEFLLAARDTGRRMTPTTEQRLRKLLVLGNLIVRPDGTFPLFGSVSPDNIDADSWGLFTAAWEQRLLGVRPRHEVIAPRTRYYSKGPVSGAASESVEDGTKVYGSGGWAFLFRAGIGVEVAIHGDPRKRTATHGDAGRGSFEVWWNGEILIRDAGNPSYSSHCRHWYRGPCGQNVSTIEGVGPGLAEEHQAGLPAWYVECQGGRWGLLGDQGVIYTWNGFSRIGQPVTAERRWRWSGERTLTLEENICGAGAVEFVTRMHVGCGAWEHLCGDLLRYKRGDRRGVAWVRLAFPKSCSLSLDSSVFSPWYGKETRGRCIVIRGRVVLPVSWAASWQFEYF